MMRDIDPITPLVTPSHHPLVTPSHHPLVTPSHHPSRHFLPSPPRHSLPSPLLSLSPASPHGRLPPSFPLESSPVVHAIHSIHPMHTLFLQTIMSFLSEKTLLELKRRMDSEFSALYSFEK